MSVPLSILDSIASEYSRGVEVVIMATAVDRLWPVRPVRPGSMIAMAVTAIAVATIAVAASQ